MVPVYVLGGVGAAGILTGTLLGITVLSGKSDCEDKKAAGTFCSEDDISSLETRRTLTDVSLLVGLGSLAIAGVLFFTRDEKKPEPRTTAHVTPQAGAIAGGGFLGLSGTF